MQLEILFLGVGAAVNQGLGNSSAVLLQDSRPLLMIDCGFDSLERFKSQFDNQLPPALFITHCHFDHIGGLEQLYFQASLSDQRPILYVPLIILATLHNQLLNTALAEGGESVWDVFDLRPVTEHFFINGLAFKSIPVRHHAPNSAFGLHLPGHFFYSGDTRPIPEVIQHCITQNEVIFHDCCIQGNPSHTGLDDLIDAYSKQVLARLNVYHYHTPEDVQQFAAAGIKVVEPFQRFLLSQQPSYQYTPAATNLHALA